MKEQIRTGKLKVLQVIELASTNEAIAKMRIAELLESIPGIGKVRATSILNRLGISGSRRIQGLGVLQLQRLKREFTPPTGAIRSGKLLVLSGPGGVGKSTITTNIAVEMSYRKAEVIIIDTDPQKTSINWIDRRNELIEKDKLDLPRISGVSKDGNVKEIIKDFVTKYDVVLIDASGRDSQSLRTALTVADKLDRKSTRLNSSHTDISRMPSSA